MSANTPKEESKTKKPKKGLFGLFDKGLKLDGAFESGIPVKYVPYILFVAFIGILYIGLTHYSEHLDKQYKEQIKELEGLKAQYNTLKSEYMFDSKQSQVAEKVIESGLGISNEPPKKILVKDGKY